MYLGAGCSTSIENILSHPSNHAASSGMPTPHGYPSATNRLLLPFILCCWPATSSKAKRVVYVTLCGVHWVALRKMFFLPLAAALRRHERQLGRVSSGTKSNLPLGGSSGLQVLLALRNWTVALVLPVQARKRTAPPVPTNLGG